MSQRGIRQAVLIALLLIGVAGSAERAFGQFTICSGGPNDGGSCQAHQDCLPGSCVLIQGVCNGGGTDGFPCDCPSGICNASPICTSDNSLGTCGGGSFNAQCCDVRYNCENSAPCIGSQKICCSGAYKGFSCLSDDQCASGGSCISTGRFCQGGDFDSYTCCDNSDCGTGGQCVSAGANAPTATPTPQLPPTHTVPIATQTPTTRLPSPAGTLPTATRTVAGITPTRTATLAAGPSLATDIGVFNRTIVLLNASSLPASGTVVVGAERMRYPRRSGDTLLDVERGVDGSVATGHAAGAPVQLVDTPPPTPIGGPVVNVYRATAEGASCALTPQPQASALWWSIVALAAVAVGRRRIS